MTKKRYESVVRDAAKQETREALLRAGLAELGEKGLDGPSLDGICARAGYTRGAFYVHFRDREDFIVAVMEWVLGDFLERMLAAGAGDAGLDEVVGRFAEAFAAGAIPLGQRDSIRSHHVLQASARSERFRSRLTDLVNAAAERLAHATQEGQREGRIRRSVDGETLGRLLVALAFGLMQMQEIGVAIDAGRARDAVLEMVAGGRRHRSGRTTNRNRR